VTLLSSKEPYRQTDTQTHRAYKWLQVPPFNLTVNVGKDKGFIIGLGLLLAGDRRQTKYIKQKGGINNVH